MRGKNFGVLVAQPAQFTSGDGRLFRLVSGSGENQGVRSPLDGAPGLVGRIADVPRLQPLDGRLVESMSVGENLVNPVGCYHFALALPAIRMVADHPLDKYSLDRAVQRTVISPCPFVWTTFAHLAVSALLGGMTRPFHSLTGTQFDGLADACANLVFRTISLILPHCISNGRFLWALYCWLVSGYSLRFGFVISHPCVRFIRSAIFQRPESYQSLGGNDSNGYRYYGPGHVPSSTTLRKTTRYVARASV